MLKTVDQSRSSPSETRDQHMDALWHSLQSWHSRPFDPPVVEPPRIDASEYDAAIGVILAQYNEGKLDHATASSVLRVLLTARIQDQFLRSLEGSYEPESRWFFSAPSVVRHG